MPHFSIQDLAKIIERESKSATYKFALLRATIEIIQEQEHYLLVHEDSKVSYPMGSMVMKWIRYYYPIIARNLRQVTSRRLAFQTEFEKVIDLYREYPANANQLFYDLKHGISDSHRKEAVIDLLKKLRGTIAKQPMHYIGGSIGMTGKLYSYEKGPVISKQMPRIDLEWIVTNLGRFAFPVELQHQLQIVGSFLTGTHSIIFKWAEFSSKLPGENQIDTASMIALLKDEYNEREIQLANDYYKQILEKGSLECIWSGKRIRNRSDMHIDHMIPFSVLNNNDLWNLMPSTSAMNSKKKDKIPSPQLLERKDVKERIIDGWSELQRAHQGQFRSEIQLALLGNKVFREKTWKNASYENLIVMCHHMIDLRGLDPWNP